MGGGPPYPQPSIALPDSGIYANPQGFQPAPQQSGRPTPIWNSGRVRANWEGVANGCTNLVEATYRYYVWHSATFDLRPDLGVTGQSERVSRAGVVPIWRPYGAGGQLVVMTTFTNVSFGGASALNDLNIVYYDEADPFDATNIRPITPEQDVSTAFLSSNQSGFGFNPPEENRGLSGFCMFTPPAGSGSPVRFWRLTLVFRFFVQHVDPVLALSAGYY